MRKVKKTTGEVTNSNDSKKNDASTKKKNSITENNNNNNTQKKNSVSETKEDEKKEKSKQDQDKDKDKDNKDKKEIFKSRAISKKLLSREQSEGVGARVRRSIGRSELQNFDPFLLLDEFLVGPPAGFPDHPHRGFETVTYMLPTTKGWFEHEDFCGHRGKIGPGDLQWMTAGKGILHSEMPASKELSHGLQLWVNLASKDKLCEPAYQELKATDIPHVEKDGVTAIVIAGEALGSKSKVYTRTPTHYLHFQMKPNSKLNQPIPNGWNAFIYTIDGVVLVGDKQDSIPAHYTIALSKEGDGITVQTGSDSADFVLISGRPNNEPIVQRGPFVMNTQQEIMQAFTDFQYGKNGFEKASGWRSEIGRSITERESDD